MKYTKTAVAVAIAGCFAVPMAAQAETTLSGVVQVKFQGTDEDDNPDTPQEEGAANMAAGDVRVAIATEHELDSGLIGYGNLQFNLDDLTGEGGINQSLQIPQADPDGSLTDEDEVELNSAATVASDNVYVGVKGGFGDVRFGEIPLAVEYGQLANDIHDVGGTVVDGVSYTGTFGIFGVGLNYSTAQDSDMFGAGAKFNFAGATIGLGFEDRDELTNFAIGASYAIAGFSIAAHTWTKGQVDFETDDGTGTTTLTTDLDDETNFAVQVGYGIAGVSLGLTFSVLTTETGEDGTTNTSESEQSVIRFDAGYDLGGGMDVSTRIQNTSTDNDVGVDPDDLVEWRVMLSKSF